MLSLPLFLLLFAANWDPRLASQYLDARQKEWLSFKPAAAPGGSGTCASCHGGLLYALARPALRKALHEGSQPTEYEKEIVDGLRARRDKKPEEGGMFGYKKEPLLAQGAAVEAIFAAYLLPGDERALDRMLQLQLKEGEDRGAWKWLNFNFEPWEGPESKYFGAVIASLALQSAPAPYRKKPAAVASIEDLNRYLIARQSSQPLHNRLMLLWTRVAPKDIRKQIIAEAWKQQRPDGEWTQESLGPWSKPLRPGTGDYATALAAYSLVRSGEVKPTDERLRRTLAWLASRQDKQKGHWSAQSMNKDRDPDSMPGQFMNDAATAFAALALLEAKFQ